MKRLAILAVLIATPAFASTDPGDPHRDWGQTLALDMNLTDATACVARVMNRHGKVLVLPVDGGTDIEYSPTGFIGGSTVHAWERFQLRSMGAQTTMRVFYRHPFIQRTVDTDVKHMRKRCLKVAGMEPGAP